MKAREIKDLSIALEALSRINSYQIEKLSDRIRDLLDTILTEEETPKPESKPSTNPDDEIPF